MAAQTNYTAEMTAKAIEMYESGTALEEIAEAIGKGVRSVRSKLVREGVYVAPEKPAKAAKVEGPTKKEMLNELESLAPFSVDGLMGATKDAIGELIDFALSVQAEQPQEEADADEPAEAEAETVEDVA